MTKIDELTVEIKMDDKQFLKRMEKLNKKLAETKEAIDQLNESIITVNIVSKKTATQMRRYSKWFQMLSFKSLKFRKGII